MSQKAYTLATATLFALIGLLHILRIVFGWQAILEGRSIPVWVSWVGLVVAGFFAFAGFRLVKKSG